MRTVRLPTVHVLVAATRCQYEGDIRRDLGYFGFCSYVLRSQREPLHPVKTSQIEKTETIIWLPAASHSLMKNKLGKPFDYATEVFRFSNILVEMNVILCGAICNRQQHFHNVLANSGQIASP